MAPDTVEQVIGAARDALHANATFQAFLASRSQRQAHTGTTISA
jgi:hypothetical protein